MESKLKIWCVSTTGYKAELVGTKCMLMGPPHRFPSKEEAESYISTQILAKTTAISVWEKSRLTCFEVDFLQCVCKGSWGDLRGFLISAEDFNNSKLEEIKIEKKAAELELARKQMEKIKADYQALVEESEK